MLAQLPFDPKAAQLCDEGNIEAVENPLMADAARAVAGTGGFYNPNIQSIPSILKNGVLFLFIHDIMKAIRLQRSNAKEICI